MYIYTCILYMHAEYGPTPSTQTFISFFYTILNGVKKNVRTWHLLVLGGDCIILLRLRILNICLFVVDSITLCVWRTLSVECAIFGHWPSLDHVFTRNIRSQEENKTSNKKVVQTRDRHDHLWIIIIIRCSRYHRRHVETVECKRVCD